MADFQIAHDLLISVVLLFGFLFSISTTKVEQVTKRGTVIGIDLGTTYSSVGVGEYGIVKVIANDQLNRITPSCVSFTDSEILIGEAAKNQTSVNPERTIFDVKRLIGRNQVKMKDGETKFFSPEEISAMIMTKMKETAEALLKKKIKDAVVTVPAYFNDAQRQATKDACAIAGLNVARIIDEPTAAVIACAFDRKAGQRNVLVFHLGGGTCYASILSIDNGDVGVLSTSADIHLGGEDFDRTITDYLIWLIKNMHGKDIINKDVIGKLIKEAERAKRALSREHQVRVEIESLLSEPLSRSQFEKLSKKLLRKAMSQVMEAMQEAKLEKEQIDEIVMVGGSSRIPKVQQLLEDYFKGKKPSDHGFHPDETVAFGASFLAGTLSEDGGGVSVSDFMLPLDSLEVSKPLTKEDSEYLARIVEKMEEEERIENRARLVEKVEEEERNYQEKIEML
ncbi:Luminal-binding protein 5 [Linum perenne]